MRIWSVAFYVGRSGREQRLWFASEREAEAWQRDPSNKTLRGLTGPYLHTVSGKTGLLSLLTKYAT